MNKFMVQAQEWCDLFRSLMGEDKTNEREKVEEPKTYEKEGKMLSNVSFIREEFDENGDMTYRHIEKYKDGKCIENETYSKEEPKDSCCKTKVLDSKSNTCGCNEKECKHGVCTCEEKAPSVRKTRVGDLKEKIQTLEEDNKTLKNINMEMGHTIDDLVDDCKKLTEKCKKLTEECDKLAAENKKYCAMIYEIKNAIKTWER